jgi:chromosome segregation ATPase
VNPNDPSAPTGQPVYQLPQAQSSGGGIKTAILFGCVAALIGANIYLYTQINGLRADMEKMNSLMIAEVDKAKDASSIQAAAAQRNIETMKEELEAARRQASMAVGQAKVDAMKNAEELARRLEREQKAVEQRLRTEVSKVEEKATEASTKIGEVSKDVGEVKTDLSATKSELDKTIAELKSTRGDLGVQSGLIATNAKELAALKALGERNYFDINLGKTKQPQRIGDILVQLKKADQKKNRYTIDIVADDKKVEKKDKGVNEPVQFYTSKARLPYEIVVNEVRKDQIVGYLSTPKVTR